MCKDCITYFNSPTFNDFLVNKNATLDYRVNDFFFGDIWEYAAKKKDKFPVMLCTLIESRVTGKLDTFSFQIGFLI